MVFTLLAVTAVGLVPITVMVYREWQQKRHSPPRPSPEQADQSEGIQNSPSSKAIYGVYPDKKGNATFSFWRTLGFGRN